MPEDDTNVANSSLVRHSPSHCPPSRDGQALGCEGSLELVCSVTWVQGGDTPAAAHGVQSGIVGPARDAAKSEGGRVVEKRLQKGFSEGLKPPLG